MKRWLSEAFKSIFGDIGAESPKSDTAEPAPVVEAEKPVLRYEDLVGYSYNRRGFSGVFVLSYAEYTLEVPFDYDIVTDEVRIRSQMVNEIDVSQFYGTWFADAKEHFLVHRESLNEMN